jgi:hypothetical protein
MNHLPIIGSMKNDSQSSLLLTWHSYSILHPNFRLVKIAKELPGP